MWYCFMHINCLTLSALQSCPPRTSLFFSLPIRLFVSPQLLEHDGLENDWDAISADDAEGRVDAHVFNRMTAMFGQPDYDKNLEHTPPCHYGPHMPSQEAPPPAATATRRVFRSYRSRNDALVESFKYKWSTHNVRWPKRTVSS